jgi:hypothetical protein
MTITRAIQILRSRDFKVEQLGNGKYKVIDLTGAVKPEICTSVQLVEIAGCA